MQKPSSQGQKLETVGLSHGNQRQGGDSHHWKPERHRMQVRDMVKPWLLTFSHLQSSKQQNMSTMMHHRQKYTGWDVMIALDLFAAFHGIEIEMVFQPSQKSTGPSPRFEGFFRLCQFLFGKIMFSFCHFHAERTLATELYEPCPGNKQWVLGAATSSEATDPGFCFPVVVWVGMVLVISIKPLQGTNICLQAHTFHGTS